MLLVKEMDKRKYRWIEMKAGLYYRKSTRDKQELDMQISIVRDYCKREEIEIFKEYSDEGQSGKKESRPAFDNLMRDMRAGLIDYIVVYKMDRIGRSLLHLVKLFEEFEKKKIKFISVTQAFNTTTPEGKLMLRMLMILAEYERELTVARVMDGLEVAKSKGKRLGRPPGARDKKRRVISGYHRYWAENKGRKNHPPKKTKINEVNSEDIDK